MELNRLLLVLTLTFISWTNCYQIKYEIKSENDVQEIPKIDSENIIEQADEAEDDLELNCGSPPNVTCGKFVGSDYSMGAKLVLKCDTGCKISGNHGNPEIHCIPVPDPFHRVVIWDAFSGQMPRCEPISRQNMQCGAPPPVTCGVYNGTGHNMGDRRKLLCNPECQVTGSSNEIICVPVPNPFHPAAVWEPYVGVMPSCEPKSNHTREISCDPPTPPPNGYCVGTDYSLYANVTVKCHTGYTLKGSDILECLPTPYPNNLVWAYVGQWTDSYCQKQTGQNENFSEERRVRQEPSCRKPTPPENGYIVGTSYSLYVNVTIRCDPGYTLSGANYMTCLPAPRPNVYVWVFGIGGEPSCDKSTCGPPPPPPAHGFIVGTNYSVYASVKIGCNPGYELSGADNMKCIPAPRPNVFIWALGEGGIPTCILSCGKPAPLTNGYITGNNYTIGNQVVLHCFPGYILVSDSSVMHCVPVSVPGANVVVWDLYSHEDKPYCLPLPENNEPSPPPYMYTSGIHKRMKDITGNRKEPEKERCLSPKNPGRCRASITRYYYNSTLNACEEFKWGGCYNSEKEDDFKQENNFKKRKECEETCKRKN